MGNTRQSTEAVGNLKPVSYKWSVVNMNDDFKVTMNHPVCIVVRLLTYSGSKH